MKPTALTFLLLFFAATLFSQTKHTTLEITHRTGDFYAYTTYKEVGGTPYPSNSMYLITARGAVLFDTPCNSTQFLPLMDCINTEANSEISRCEFRDTGTLGVEGPSCGAAHIGLAKGRALRRPCDT
jgi:metallo-beta-lactamase class B